MMTNKHLNELQEKALYALSKQPMSGYGWRSSMKALVTRGYAQKVNIDFVITDSGCEYLGLDSKVVAVRYALYNLNNGWQIRHNVKQLKKPGFARYEYVLEYVWLRRTIEQEIEAVYQFQMRAIELARAEIRAGIAR